MKKVLSVLLVLVLVLSMAAFAGADEAVNTGFAMVTAVTGKNAAAKDGTAQTEITAAAVTVDANGVIDACVIDMVQAKINFNAAGEITTDKAATFPSKNALGDAYGMRIASSIDAEWNEQAAAFAAWCVGKTLDEVKGIAVDEDGMATDVDVVASVTLKVSSFVAIVEAAYNNAKPCGARKGDAIKLTSYTVCSSSKNATAAKAGNAQAYAMLGAFTFNGDVITSAIIDAVQANCAFDAAGIVTADLSQPVASKDELGDAYGMRVASAIDKEWNEQAEGYCQYITGMTLADAIAIPMNDSNKTDDADLATSCTIMIDGFQQLLIACVE